MFSQLKKKTLTLKKFENITNFIIKNLYVDVTINLIGGFQNIIKNI